MTSSQMFAWQRRFYQQPMIWATLDSDGNLGHLYESREAAETEVRWSEKHPPRVSIGVFHVHSMELARERWQVPEPPKSSAD